MEVNVEPAGEAKLIPPHRCYVEVCLSQLAANYENVARTIPAGASMMPVVKANAYGHGAVQVAHKLVECGARWFAVSSAEEGAELRESGISLPVRIVVMAGILPFEWDTVFANSLTPVIHGLAELAQLERMAAHHSVRVPFHFKLDTGLSRLGSIDTPEKIAETFQGLLWAQPEGLLTHFASAANLRSSQTQDQLSRFQQLTEALRTRGIPVPIRHVDSTNSLHFPHGDETLQLVRPGHALYGYVTHPPGNAPAGRLNVRPVLSWRTRVLLTKSLAAGTTVGYGALHRTTRPTTIAVLGVGYADGYPHRLSKVGRVLIRGKSAPILGSISMDLTTVDVTGIPDAAAGDVVTLLGNDGEYTIDAIDLGRMAGTISYAVLTNIHGRVKRVFVP